MTLAATCLALLLTQAPPNQPERDVIPINTRNFAFPLRYDPERKDSIAELQLFVSRDHGQTWTRTARVGPDETSIVVKEERDGLAWYTLRIIDRKGNADPADLSKSPVMQKVLIETGEK